MSLAPARANSSEYPTKLKVAVVQFAPTTGVPDATARNLARMAAYVADAWKQGVKLVLFPELGTCGYGISTEEVGRAVDAAPLVIERMCALSRQYGLRIVASYPVRGDGGLLYIAASVFSPSGAVELTYHKTHPWAASTFENAHFALGSAFADSIPLLSFPHVEDPDPAARGPAPLPTSHAFDDAWLNVLVCWDLEFPEPARCVRLRTPGAHHASPLVLCVPTANGDGFVAAHTLRARAAENHVFLACANLAGAPFCGGSCVLGPDGAVLASVDGTEERMVSAEIDLGADAYAAARAVNPMLEWRRPELYAALGEEERWEKPSQRPGGF